MILSQTKIFNIFSSKIQLGKILKILTNNCDRETINYIPTRDLWINRLYMSLSSKSKHPCLTIDCRKSGPEKYRTNADSNLLAKKISQNENLLVFQMDGVINVT